MKSGKIILGTIAGVTAGTVLGVLFAPDKGSVTRKNISRKSTDYADAMKMKIDTYADTMTQKVDTFKDKAIDWLERQKTNPAPPDPKMNSGTDI